MSTTRTFVRGLATVATIGGLALGLVAPAAAVPSVPSSPESGTAVDEGPTPAGDPLFRPVYGDDIFKLVFVDGLGGYIPSQIDFEEWSTSYDFQAPVVVTPESYEKHAWSSTIYASTKLETQGASSDIPLVEGIDGTEWARVGYPSPTTVGRVGGDDVVKWGTGDELFLVAVDDEFHKLSGREWAAIDYYGPTYDETDIGFLKLSWNDAIAGMNSLASGDGSPISYEEWSSYDFPTPRVQQRITGDAFEQDCGDPAIYYYGPSLERQITFAEWQAAGAPTPDVYCG